MLKELSTALTQQNDDSLAQLYMKLYKDGKAGFELICCDIEKYYCYYYNEQTKLYQNIGLNELSQKIGEILLNYIQAEYKTFRKTDYDDEEEYEKTAKKFSGLIKVLGKLATKHTVTKTVCNLFVNKELDEKLDTDPSVVNFRNGLVNLRDGKFRVRTKNDYFTLCLPYEYTENKDQEKMNELRTIMKQICNDSEEELECIMRVFGYLMTGETKEQKFFSFYGGGGNGKTIMSMMYAHAMSIYFKTVDPKMCEEKYEKAHKELIQCGAPIRVVQVPEVNNNKINTQLIKNATEQEGIISVEVLYGSSTPVKIYFKFYFVGNHLMNFPVDKGIQRRGFQKEYKNEFVDVLPKTKKKGVYLKDKTIEEKLHKTEYKQSWFHLMLPYAIAYYKNGLVGMESMKEEFDSLCETNDKVKDFIDQNFDLTNHEQDRIHKDDFLQMYRDATNLKYTEFRHLLSDLKRLNIKYDRKAKRDNKVGCVIGLKLKDEELETGFKHKKEDPLDAGTKFVDPVQIPVDWQMELNSMKEQIELLKAENEALKQTLAEKETQKEPEKKQKEPKEHRKKTEKTVIVRGKHWNKGQKKPVVLDGDIEAEYNNAEEDNGQHDSLSGF